jgi:hypothetical protein
MLIACAEVEEWRGDEMQEVLDQGEILQARSRSFCAVRDSNGLVGTGHGRLSCVVHDSGEHSSVELGGVKICCKQKQLKIDGNNASWRPGEGSRQELM